MRFTFFEINLKHKSNERILKKNGLKIANTVHFQIQNHLKISWASIRHLELEIDFSKIGKKCSFFSAKSQVLYLLHFSIQKPEGGATF